MPNKAFIVELRGTWHDGPAWWLNFVNSHNMPTVALLKELEKANATYVPPSMSTYECDVIKFKTINDYYLFVLKYS